MPRFEHLVRLCPVSHKRQFSSERAARKQLDRAASMDDPFWTVQRPYLCPDCDAWHLTSKPYQMTRRGYITGHPEALPVLYVLARPDTVLYTAKGIQRTILDASPMFIPWHVASGMRHWKLITWGASTPDGFRQLALAPAGSAALRELAKEFSNRND